MGRNFTNESHESYAAYRMNLHMAEELGVVGALDRYGLDALVMPTFASFHLPAIAGLPIVTVPLGAYTAHTTPVMNSKGTMYNVAPNIPFGIAFIGRRWSEETLISLAYAFEQRTMVRGNIKPYIKLVGQIPTADAAGDVVRPWGENGTFAKSEARQTPTHRTLKGLVSMTRRTWPLHSMMQSLVQE